MSQIMCPALAWPPWDSNSLESRSRPGGGTQVFSAKPLPSTRALVLSPDTISVQQAGPALPWSSPQSWFSRVQNITMNCHLSYSEAEAGRQKVKGLPELPCEFKLRPDHCLKIQKKV